MTIVDVGRLIDAFDSVHEWYGVCQMNFEGRMLLEFCLLKVLYVTCFKADEKRKVTLGLWKK